MKFPTALAAAALLVACAGSPAGITENGTAAVRPAISQYGTPVNVANNSSHTIRLLSFTQPPFGYVGCPWELTNTFGYARSIVPYGSSGNGLKYVPLGFDHCNEPNEPGQWSIAYGTNPSNPATVCAWYVSYQAAGFAWGAISGASVRCTESFQARREDLNAMPAPPLGTWTLSYAIVDRDAEHGTRRP